MRKAPKGRRTEQDVHGQDSGRDGQKSQLHGQERWSQESSPPWKKIDRKATSALAWFYCFNSWFYKNPPGGMHSWGKFWTKDTKRPKSQLALLKSLEKKQDVGSKSWVLGMPPALNATGGGHLCQPSSPGHTHTLAAYKEKPRHPHPLAARGSEQVSKGNCCLSSILSAAAGAPIKPCLKWRGKKCPLFL